MALLPARNILDGTALPVTSLMKTSLGSLRDYLADLLGTDSSNKAAARIALGAAESGANSSITSLSAVTSINGGQLGGLRNRIINGGMQVAQRGSSGTITGSYSLDRWILSASGTAPAWSQQTTSSTAAGNYGFKALSWAGVAGNTGVLPLQRIESINCADMAGQTVSLSFWIYQSTGATQNITPAVVYSGGAADSWGSQTGIAALDAATAVPSGIWTKVTNRFLLPIAATTGLAVYPWSSSITFGAGAVGYLAFVQLELGPVATPFEQRPYGMERLLCRNYYRVYATAQNVNDLAYDMRATPTQAGAGPYTYSVEL